MNKNENQQQEKATLKDGNIGSIWSGFTIHGGLHDLIKELSSKTDVNYSRLLQIFSTEFLNMKTENKYIELDRQIVKNYLTENPDFLNKYKK